MNENLNKKKFVKASRYFYCLFLLILLSLAILILLLMDNNVILPTSAESTFRSTNDSFSVQVPDGWIILDLNNTGSMLSEESRLGYGLLAQLCPEEEQTLQQGVAAANNATAASNNRCQGEVIHIIRYPDLNIRMQRANNSNFTQYHLQMLQQVGYSSIQIVNTVDTRVNITMAQTNQTITTLPAKSVEMLYATASAPDEIRRGYFLLTATNATAPNLGTTKGYSVFYEGSSVAPAEVTAIYTGLSSLPPVVGQVFDSFELIAAPEVGQGIAAQLPPVQTIPPASILPIAGAGAAIAGGYIAYEFRRFRRNLRRKVSKAEISLEPQEEDPEQDNESYHSEYDSKEEKTTEEILERYPYARFPSKIVLQDIVPLDIIIKVARTSTDANSIKITPKKDEIAVPITMIIDPGTFEAQGENNDNYFTIIYVPVEPQDSVPVTFFLKAKVEGPQSINIRFYQPGIFLGKLTVNTLVVSSREEIQDPQSQTISAEWRLPRKTYPGADITLFIIERTDEPMKYHILLQSAEFLLRGLGPIPFKESNPEAKFRSMIEDIERDLRLPANVVENRIRAKGRTLYDEIFPEALKNLYWEKREIIKSIHVISAEPWIPWEIIKPYRTTQDGRVEEDPFLCERYSFSRWLQDVPNKPEENQLKKAVLVAPSNTDLKQAYQEAKWFKEFARNVGLVIVDDISAYEEVIHTLENEEFDLLHVTSHGFYNPGNSSLSALKLGDGGEIRPDEIGGPVANFGRFKPVVILNACQTGALGFSLTKTMGWSKSIIEAGSSVFIGTAWSVTDQTAFKFVQSLYDELGKGTVLGEAVRRARNNCKSTGDPSWLAYQLYGHPFKQIKFGQK